MYTCLFVVMEAITKLAINNPLGNDKLYVDSV